MAKSQMPLVFGDDTLWYRSSLKSVSDSAEMLYKYNNVVHGFSTRLTPDEAQSMKTQPGVVSVLEDVKYELQTTRTPEFLGLYQSADLFPGSDSMSDVIIGVLDTGVWPESKSFDDSGMGPVPRSWKGVCESGTNFNSSNCNRKLIGASLHWSNQRNTAIKITTRRHRSGTHTSTTAAGSSVAGASLFGYARGTARGMASRARVAVYKVCWLLGCVASDILAGMDKAIDEKVDVISLSIGAFALPYYIDTIAIGAFAAMENGIFVSCSAGNMGPYPATVLNVAPWITTVGAGTLDRDFPAYVSLGNGVKFFGASLYKGPSLLKKMLPFVYAGNASNWMDGNLCVVGSLIPEKVRGKIVLCEGWILNRAESGIVVKEAGDPNPRATIVFEGTELGIKPSPVVAGFSSRGPNPITPEVLKPDLMAPGVNIIAGWSGKAGPTQASSDDRRVEFSIISGTSMACAHVSGLAALLKGAHPQWSPAAIRSALMTTAYTTYKDGQPFSDSADEKPSTPFGHGAGQVDPVKALDPGLVYDLDVHDYLSFLCALNYTASEINTVTRSNNFTCDPKVKYSSTNVNYPSFAVPLQSGGGNGSTILKYTRTLTNVGPAATYNVSVNMQNESVKVMVEPSSLTFSQVNDKQSYTVQFTVSSLPILNSYSYGSIEWWDGKHVVKSSVVISWR
ncbi:hypothetical protein C3L33_01298, partial [Rhododendron williamsianum]